MNSIIQSRIQDSIHVKQLMLADEQFLQKLFWIRPPFFILVSKKKLFSNFSKVDLDPAPLFALINIERVYFFTKIWNMFFPFLYLELANLSKMLH